MAKPQPEQSSTPVESANSTQSAQKNVLARVFLPILLAVTAVVACLAILAIAFKNDSTSVNYYYPGQLLSPVDSNSETLPLLQRPQEVSDDGTKILLPSAAISLVVALFMIFLCIFVMRRSKSLLLSTMQRGLLWFFLVSSAVISLVAVIFAGVTHARSDHFDPNYRSNLPGAPSYGPNNEYPGSFDSRSWTCDVLRSGLYQDTGHDMSETCLDETAAFYGVLVMMLFNFALLGLVMLDWLSGRCMLIRSFTNVVRDYELKHYLDDGNWEEALKGERRSHPRHV